MNRRSKFSNGILVSALGGEEKPAQIVMQLLIATIGAAPPRALDTVDERSESVGKKIHDAEVGKLPYMLVVGDRESSDGAVSVRSHAEGDLGTESVEQFAARVNREVSGA